MSNPFSALIKVDIEEKRIADLLVGAFEGGSNYWIDGITKVKPVERTFTYNEDGSPSFYDDPFNKGGEIRIQSSEGTHILNRDAIIRGLEVMSNEYANHFNDFLKENDDASTSDIFLQCCLFGKVIFG